LIILKRAKFTAQPETSKERRLKTVQKK